MDSVAVLTPRPWGKRSKSTACFGGVTYTRENGDFPVALWIALLYANSAWGKTRSHCFGLSPQMLRTKLPKVLLLTYVWSSIWGCEVELRFKVVLNFFHKVTQKLLISLTSRFEVMDWGTQCKRTTSWKNNRATWEASEVFRQGRKCVIFENLSTTMNTESTPHWVRGSPNTKSIDKSSQMLLATGRGIYRGQYSESALWIPDKCSTSSQNCQYLASTKARNIVLPYL